MTDASPDGWLLQLRGIPRALVPDRPWLVLDLAAVPASHPSAVAVLAAAQRRLRPYGSRVALWRLRAQPAELSTTSGCTAQSTS